MRTVISLVAVFLLADFGLAQSEYRSGSRNVYQADTFRVRMPQTNQRYQRTAMRPQEFAPGSVLSSEYYPEQYQRTPAPIQQNLQLQTQTFPAPEVKNNPVNWGGPAFQQSQGFQEDYGYHPFVVGDIFGVSRAECCDEWLGHCDCLELTNSRSNCECTNQRRAHWGQGSGVGCSSCESSAGGGQFYSHTASRTPISDYFHGSKRR